MKRTPFYKNSSSKQPFVVGGASSISSYFSHFILDLFRGVYFSKHFTLLCAAVVCLPTIQPNTIPLEAAFQGKIEKQDGVVFKCFPILFN